MKSKKLILFFLFIISFLITGCKEKKENIPLKAIVIGVDGMDPKIVDTLISKGLLPNLSKLKETGTFSPLKTTNPAESPVAWASFITGTNPGKTNLFGFINRDLITYTPQYAPTERTEGNTILGFLPLQNPKYINKREGVEVWQLITNSGNKDLCAVLFCPETFPPDETNGVIISGMEVPDIRGTTGTFTFYTTDSINYLSDDNVVYLSQRDGFPKSNNETIETSITGPEDWIDDEREEVKIPLYLNAKENSLAITFDGKTINLKQGEWSDWVKFSFPLNFISNISGIGKFYLQSLEPNISLYLSPINIDPEDPFYKISEPENFSEQIAGREGLFTTLGWECDTWALNDGYLDEEAFLKQAIDVFNERKKILFELIRSDQYSLIINVFGELDRIQHMFWRYIDPENELYDPKASPEIKNAIYNYYIMIDDLVGEILNNTDQSTVSMLVSDHGFASFRRSVNLNSWLLENNFIELNKTTDEAENLMKLFFPGVNWYKTEAYSLGIGGIYLNLAGREKNGIVDKDLQYDSVRNNIIKKLINFKDPETGEKVAVQVYKKEDIYMGDYIESAPDLVVGLIPGYRVSQVSSLGGFEKNIINDNMRKWSGDHVSVDPSFVPGVLFINRKINLNFTPEIIDIAPTLLKIFEIEIPDNMDGVSVF